MAIFPKRRKKEITKMLNRIEKEDEKQKRPAADLREMYGNDATSASYLVRVERLSPPRVRIEALEWRGDVAVADGDARPCVGARHDLAAGRSKRAGRQDAVERIDGRAVVRDVPPAPPNNSESERVRERN